MNRELVYAALGATNEAILRTTAQDELFQRVCDAAVQVGMRVAVTLLPQQDGWLDCVAAAGLEAGSPLPNLRISVKSDSDRGHGLSGTAFRTAKPCISNDYQNDPRLLPWLREGRADRIGAAAAVPLLRDGASIGVFLFFVEAAHSFTEDIVGLLVRMLENVSFALQGFEREKQRKQMERANRRLTEMFAALSATNTAILRARNAADMFKMVCESVAKGGSRSARPRSFWRSPIHTG
jgi:GAF domain-containing protein